MKGVSPNKSGYTDALQMNVDPSQTTLIKIKLGLKTERDYVKSKLRRITTSEEYYMYELKVDLFDNGNP